MGIGTPTHLATGGPCRAVIAGTGTRAVEIFVVFKSSGCCWGTFLLLQGPRTRHVNSQPQWVFVQGCYCVLRCSKIFLEEKKKKISCEADLMVMNSLSLHLSRKAFISPYPKGQLPWIGYSWLTDFAFNTLRLSFHSPLACRVSAETATLCSLAALKFFLFHRFFDVLI